MSDSDLDAELNEDSKAKPEDESKGESEGKGESETKEKSEPTVPVSVLTAERKELTKQRDAWADIARAKAQPEPEKVDPVDFLAEPEKIASFIEVEIGGWCTTLATMVGYVKHVNTMLFAHQPDIDEALGDPRLDVHLACIVV